MKNKILALLSLGLLWHTLLVIQSCGTCPPEIPKFFTIQGMTVENAQYFERSDRRGSVILEPYQRIVIDDLAFTVIFDHEWEVALSNPSLASVFATSCDDGYNGSKEVLKSIIAISEYDFNEDIHKGDILNEHLTYYHFTTYFAESRKYADSLATYIERQYDSLRIDPENTFYLLTKPTLSDTVSITFTYEFYSGKVFTAASPEVIIE